MTAELLRPLVVGNWKMNLGESASVALVDTLSRSLPFDAVDVAIAPSFPCLRAVLDAAAGSALRTCSAYAAERSTNVAQRRATSFASRCAAASAMPRIRASVSRLRAGCALAAVTVRR